LFSQNCVMCHQCAERSGVHVFITNRLPTHQRRGPGRGPPKGARPKKQKTSLAIFYGGWWQPPLFCRGKKRAARLQPRNCREAIPGQRFRPPPRGGGGRRCANPAILRSKIALRGYGRGNAGRHFRGISRTGCFGAQKPRPGSPPPAAAGGGG
jgi:hypothetical protein